jgi:hypothetical protein
MSNEEPKPKDKFDKTSIIVSSLSTLLLAIIASINGLIAYQSFGLQKKTGAIQNQLEVVKNNAQTVELIQKLIEDLNSRNVRQDIALIALNRKIADNDDKSKRMVTEIATQVYRTGIKDLITKSSKITKTLEQDQNSSEAMKWTPEYKDTFVALAIIGERSPNFANTLIEELNKQKSDLFDALFIKLDNQKYALSAELDKQIKGIDTSSKIYTGIKIYKNIIEKNDIKAISDEDKKIKSIEELVEKIRIIDPTKSTEKITEIVEQIKANQKSSAPRGGVWKSFARKPLVSIASLYFSPQGAGNYTHTRLNK